MIVKVVDDNGNDMHLVEAAHFRWRSGGEILDCFASLVNCEDPVKIQLYHGDRVFFMNDSGQTVDSKRIVLPEEEWFIYGKSWSEFCEEGFAKPGTKVDVDGTAYLILRGTDDMEVGTVIMADDIVIRYRSL